MMARTAGCLVDVLALGAEKHAGLPAYWTSGRKDSPVTYRQAYDSACAVAAFLAARGVKAGDRVCIYAPNTHEWAIAFWGIALSGAVVVPVDPNSGSAEIGHIFKDTGANWAFTTARLADNLSGLGLAGVIMLDAVAPESGAFTLEGIRAGDSARPAGHHARPADPAVIIYTSGTTSQPKGVVLTHGSMLSNLSSMLHALPLGTDDRFLSIISLSHTFEITCGLVMPFMAGASVVYSKDIKYTTIFRYMAEFRPTILLGVPSMFKMLLENALRAVTGERATSLLDVEKNSAARETLARKARDLFGGRTRHFVSGGAPLAVSLSLGYRDMGIDLLQVYGLTETSGVSTLTPPGSFPVGSSGKPLVGVRLRVDERDSNGIGEICISGGHLMAGYNNNPSATAETIRDGWLHSGDLGYIDVDGFLFITGRSKNVIVTGAGVNVYPEELEERIIKSPLISEVCVVGREKPDRTETVFAVVVPDERHVNAHMRKEKAGRHGPPQLAEVIWREIDRQTADLASFKRIQGLQVRTRPLPRGRTQKVMRDMVKKESFSILGRMGLYAQYEQTETPTVFTNATAITPFRVARKSCIVIEGDKITQFGDFDSVYLPPNAQVIDLKDKYVVPGFIDLHVHGGGGYAFSSASTADLEKILGHFISHGTTRLLATIQIDQKKRFLKAVGDVARFCKKRGRHGVLHGIHLEGPFVNKDMCGALNDAYIWDATIDNQLLLEKTGRGCLRMMTMAPEVTGAKDVMQVAAQAGTVLAVGHSKASYEDVDAAIDLGLSQVTHIFNAMPTMHHRTPGVLTAAFLRKELKVHLIADGIHVHPAVVTLLYRLKGESGIILISDAISASGCDDGVYDLSDRDVTVRRGRAYLADGTLAGSTVTLDKSVKFIVENTDIPIQEVVRMATLNPARVLGLDRTKGVIAVGRDADLVVLDENLEVDMVLMEGEAVYRRQEPSRAAGT